MAALGSAIKATGTSNMHTMEGIANWVLGNFESGMDAAEIIENAVSSDASGESSGNSVFKSASNNQKSNDTVYYRLNANYNSYLSKKSSKYLKVRTDKNWMHGSKNERMNNS